MKRLIMLVIAAALLTGCSAQAPAAQEEQPTQTASAEVPIATAPLDMPAPVVASAADTVEKINEIRNWFIGDIWNYGFCDIDAYIASGKDSTGATMDVDFAIKQLDKAMKNKTDYDLFMAGLDGEYAEIGSIWGEVSEQIDDVYAFIQNGVTVGGERPDMGLLNQYSTAFDDLVLELE